MTVETGKPPVSTTPAILSADTRSRKPTAKALIIGFGLIVVCLVGLFTSTSNAMAGMWCVFLMLVLIFLAVPVALALSIPSIVGVFAISGAPASMNILSTAPYNTVASWSFSVIPAFIFMGMLLTQSGMTTRIYTATDRWFSWLPGGIGVGTTAAGAGLASVSGSTIGMTYTLARAGLPEMLRMGYDRRMAVGTVIIAGLPGALIPPSILLVVYAGIASVPVGPQLVAGAVPGVLIAITYAAFILILALIFPKLVGRTKDAKKGPRVTWGERFHSLGQVWGFPVIMIVLFGGLFSGVFTPTEAGAAAALTALALCIFYQRKNQPLKQVSQAAFAAVASTAAIFFIMIGAEMLTRLLAITGLAQIVTDFIVGMGLGRVAFLMILIVVYIIMGMFFDTLSMMLLTIPILLPTLEAMDVNPLWFGVFVILLGELGMITPPVGILSFIVHGIAQDPEVNQGQKISLGDVFTSLVWFLPVSIIFLMIMIFFPGMTEALPNLMESMSGGAPPE